MKQKFTLSMFIMSMIVLSASCNSVFSRVKENLVNLKGYKCFGATRIQTPIRLTASGNVECFSVDGRDCSTGFTRDYKCRAYVSANIGKVRPVSCTDEQSLQEDHWCFKAKKFFYNTWQCNYHTNLPVAIRMNEKTWKVECLSLDGTNCLKGKSAIEACRKANHCDTFSKTINAVPCTRNLYTEDTTNWCKKGFAYFRHDGQFLFNDRTGIKTPIRLSKGGNVECLSDDGKNCQWNIESSIHGIKKVLEITHGGSRKVNGLVCGEKHKKLYGDGGYKNKDHWCYKGYGVIFKKVLPQTPEVKKEIKKIKDNYIPHWFKDIKKIIKLPESKTKEGLDRIRKVLEDHKTRINDHRWDIIKDHITKDKPHKVIKIIKIHNPHLPNPKGGLGRKRKESEDPHWFERIIKFMKTPEAQQQFGISTIRHTFNTHKINIPEKRWKWVENHIKSGNVKNNPKVHKKVTKVLRRYVDGQRDKEREEEQAHHPPTKPKMPNWLHNVIKVLTTPVAQTERGIKYIHEVIKTHGTNLTPKQVEKVTKHIINGTTGSIARVVKIIKNNNPTIVKIINDHKEKVKERRGPKWFRELIRLIKSEEGRTDEGIEKVKKILKEHDFLFTKPLWFEIRNAIKEGLIVHTPAALRELIEKLKRHTPSLNTKYIIKENHIPKWFKDLTKYILHPDAKSPKGIKKIKDTLDDHKSFISDKHWRDVEKKIVTGQVLVPSVHEEVIKILKDNLPLFKKEDDDKPHSRSSITLKVQEGKKCGKAFFTVLVQMLKKRDAKTKSGLARIREYINTHFQVNGSLWKRISKSILDGTLRTPEGRLDAVHKIKYHIPQELLEVHHPVHEINLPRLTGRRNYFGHVDEPIRIKARRKNGDKSKRKKHHRWIKRGGEHEFRGGKRRNYRGGKDGKRLEIHNIVGGRGSIWRGYREPTPPIEEDAPPRRITGRRQRFERRFPKLEPKLGGNGRGLPPMKRIDLSKLRHNEEIRDSIYSHKSEQVAPAKAHNPARAHNEEARRDSLFSNGPHQQGRRIEVRLPQQPRRVEVRRPQHNRRGGNRRRRRNFWWMRWK